MSAQIANSIAQRFNAVRWHDSKLIGFGVQSDAEGEQVKLLLELADEGGVLSAAEVIFTQCAYIAADVYLDAKTQCSDDIADAECRTSSDWKAAVSKPSPIDPILGNRHLEDHLHFRIILCPRGGTNNVLAKGFVLAPLTARS